MARLLCFWQIQEEDVVIDVSPSRFSLGQQMGSLNSFIWPWHSRLSFRRQRNIRCVICLCYIRGWPQIILGSVLEKANTRNCHTGHEVSKIATSMSFLRIFVVEAMHSTQTQSSSYACNFGYFLNFLVGVQQEAMSSVNSMRRLCFRYRVAFVFISGEVWVKHRYSKGSQLAAKILASPESPGLRVLHQFPRFYLSSLMVASSRLHKLPPCGIYLMHQCWLGHQNRRFKESSKNPVFGDKTSKCTKYGPSHVSLFPAQTLTKMAPRPHILGCICCCRRCDLFSGDGQWQCDGCIQVSECILEGGPVFRQSGLVYSISLCFIPYLVALMQQRADQAEPLMFVKGWIMPFPKTQRDRTWFQSLCTCLICF